MKGCQMSKLLENLNEQQLPVAKRIEGKFIVNAGAGSGKTSTIVTRTAYMIEQGIDPANILMFTFTRKAALEMKERMIKKIGAIAKPVTVCTYHSFSSMLLRKFSYLIGYENNFTVCDADESEKIIKDICGTNTKLKDIAITMINKWKSDGITYAEAKQNNFAAYRGTYTFNAPKIYTGLFNFFGGGKMGKASDLTDKMTLNHEITNYVTNNDNVVPKFLQTKHNINIGNSFGAQHSPDPEGGIFCSKSLKIAIKLRFSPLQFSISKRLKSHVCKASDMILRCAFIASISFSTAFIWQFTSSKRSL